MQVVFFIISLILTLLFFIYGFNHYYLLHSARSYQPPVLPDNPGTRTKVAIHLPVYNERYVIRRLVENCAVMVAAYGIEKVRIMILDDSDDDTAREIDLVVDEYRQKQFNIEILRRDDRIGFKAGALQAALERTEEEFIAIFDADFIPAADFLLRTMPYLLRYENLGIIQSRWTHLNRDFNLLTEAIALGIDVHFLVEQTGRFSAGCFQNFNGSGGVLRKKAILQAGGWQADTLAEDLDLSYRMQLQGCQVMFLRDLLSPGEVPPTIPSFKKQQARWACGSLRTAKKILPGLLRDPEVGMKQRLQSFIHLTGYILHPLMVFSFLLTCLATITGLNNPAKPLVNNMIPVQRDLLMAGAFPIRTLQNLIWGILFPLVILCMVAPWMSSLYTLKVQNLSPGRNLMTLFVLLLLGFGLSLSNTIEAGKALLTDRIWDFNRTPKYANLKNKQEWRRKRYQVSTDLLWILELLFLLAGLLTIGIALKSSNLPVLLVMLPFVLGYAFILLFTFLHRDRSDVP